MGRRRLVSKVGVGVVGPVNLLPWLSEMSSRCSPDRYGTCSVGSSEEAAGESEGASENEEPGGRLWS